MSASGSLNRFNLILPRTNSTASDRLIWTVHFFPQLLSKPCLKLKLKTGCFTSPPSIHSLSIHQLTNRLFKHWILPTYPLYNRTFLSFSKFRQLQSSPERISELQPFLICNHLLLSSLKSQLNSLLGLQKDWTPLCPFLSH